MTVDAPAASRTAFSDTRGARAVARARAWAGASAGPIRAALAAVGRRLRIATALGWALAGVAVLALAAGVLWGWAELIAVGAAAVLVLVLAVPFVIGRAQYAVAVELASPRVVVGESAVGRVVVRAAGRRGSPSAWIVLPVGQAKAQFRVPRLAADAVHDELFQIPTQRRAVLTLGPVSSERTDPLGVLRREVAWTEPTQLYVHPRTVPLDGDTTGLLRDLEGLPTRDLADDDVSFHALREYVPGDDLRYVHWKSTARTQKLMIRQFEQTRRSQLVIALSTRADEYSDDDEFELAVSIAGSIAVSALRDGKDVRVAASESLLHAPTPAALLDLLSGVERTAAAATLAETARTVATKAPAVSIVAFVAGSAVPLQQLRQAATRVPPAAQALALRATSAESLARHVVGDLVTVDVPALGELRRAMSAVAT
ncbi:DUF58 domain-containing protein [Microbacterium capsulatum]|uniref:DUF58 domain-containing protein n=1 Tax=Microbacterium capsulatum TaxID=3041921 RepID=A0ABU0XEB5_9MICO|nr:DUF58 domain-containing protein [Microbacterium sp. ASV81]MDQ4213460.1 DUF58 domain-containing protein [Microbacterium sp. ASV81]